MFDCKKGLKTASSGWLIFLAQDEAMEFWYMKGNYLCPYGRGSQSLRSTHCPLDPHFSLLWYPFCSFPAPVTPVLQMVQFGHSRRWAPNYSWSYSPRHKPPVSHSLMLQPLILFPNLCWSISLPWKVQQLPGSLLVTQGPNEYVEVFCMVSRVTSWPLLQMLLHAATLEHLVPLTCFIAFSYCLTGKAAGPESCSKRYNPGYFLMIWCEMERRKSRDFHYLCLPATRAGA